MKKILIIGNTYPVRTQLKALGATWAARQRGWLVPEDKAQEAREIVDSAGESLSSARSRNSTYRKSGQCEDAPCCGCCGPQGDGDYYGANQGDY